MAVSVRSHEIPDESPAVLVGPSERSLRDRAKLPAVGLKARLAIGASLPQCRELRALPDRLEQRVFHHCRV